MKFHSKSREESHSELMRATCAVWCEWIGDRFSTDGHIWIIRIEKFNFSDWRCEGKFSPLPRWAVWHRQWYAYPTACSPHRSQTRTHDHVTYCCNVIAGGRRVRAHDFVKTLMKIHSHQSTTRVCTPPIHPEAVYVERRVIEHDNILFVKVVRCVCVCVRARAREQVTTRKIWIRIWYPANRTFICQTRSWPIHSYVT